jgi:hypothetical protein
MCILDTFTSKGCTNSLYTNKMESTCDVDVTLTMNDIEISVCSYTIPLNVQL